MTKGKILIVEDEVSLRDALGSKLTHEGFTVLEAVNGEEGLAMAEKELPDLILLDVVMPRMDGMTMLTALRAQSWGKDMKVIMLTNEGNTEKVAESLEAGAYDYLVKSDWKLEEILEKIHAVLGMSVSVHE